MQLFFIKSTLTFNSELFKFKNMNILVNYNDGKLNNSY